MTYPEALDEALVLRLDRRRPPPPRRRQLHAAVLAAPEGQRLEPRQHRPRPAVDRGEAHDQGGSGGVRKRDRVIWYDRAAAPLRPDDEARFRRAAKAWAYFSAAPPSYRRACLLWVGDAKRDETREQRLAILDRQLGQRAADSRAPTRGMSARRPSGLRL